MRLCLLLLLLVVLRRSSGIDVPVVVIERKEPVSAVLPYVDRAMSGDTGPGGGGEGLLVLRRAFGVLLALYGWVLATGER